MNCKDIKVKVKVGDEVDVKVGDYILFKNDLGYCGVADQYQHYGGTVHQVTVIFSEKRDKNSSIKLYLDFEADGMHWEKKTIEKIVQRSVNPEYFL